MPSTRKVYLSPLLTSCGIFSCALILGLNNNWEEYTKNDKYKVRDVEIKEVEKMLGCMDVEKGYTSYMARYVRHPAIADSRIIGYDTKNVTFKYERDGKLNL